MLHFFYDSLDTLKKVKKPTWKEVRVFTLQVFVVVIISSVMFLIFDNLRGNFYKQIFATFGSPSPSTITTQQPIEGNTLEVPAVPTENAPTDAVDVVVDGAEVVPVVEGDKPAEEVAPVEAPVE